jgi:hypothetical protein
MHAGDCSTKDKIKISMQESNLNNLGFPFANVEASET